MNKYIYHKWLLLLIITCTAVSSCKKSFVQEGASSLTVINAVVGSPSTVINFNADKPLYWFSSAAKQSFGIFSTANKFNSFSGDRQLAIYNFPDTLGAPLKSIRLNLPVGSINSLYFTGTKAAPDTVFIKESIPYYGIDSVAGIRFVNLSLDDRPVSINLTGQPQGSTIGQLPYKGVTPFIKFPANSKIFNYVFEFRDAVSGELISTYTARNVGQPGLDYSPNGWIFKNNTLALAGIRGNTTAAPRIMLIQNF